MSAGAVLSASKPAAADKERWHRFFMRASYALAALLVAGLTVYGFDYYWLDASQRPFSLKDSLLRPNGTVGLWLGVVGTAFFLIIFLYALRKHWDWLRRRGNTRHWLELHELLGLTAPFLIAFHASFKFHGLAGVAFWIMVVVAVSGVVGRYIYTQIPRSLNAAELSLQEIRDEQARLTAQLTAQKLFSPEMLAPLFRLPSAARVQSLPLPFALAVMVSLDLARFMSGAGLRWRALGFWGRLGTFGGLLTCGDREVERVISIARQQAALSKRILFLSRSQNVFHLWHVIHKPFSYSFAALALLHIAVVLVFGVR